MSEETPTVDVTARTRPTQAPAPSRAKVALLAGGVTAAVAAGVASLALILVEEHLALQTAVPLVVTAMAMALAGAAGGARTGRVGPAMGAALLALLVVGFPLFVAMEPVWWRYSAGIAGAIVVVAALAYGVPEGFETGHLTARQAAGAWLTAPGRLLRAVAWALMGRDDAVARR